MGQVRSALRRLLRSPGVPQARHVAERSVTPYLRADLHHLGVDHAQTVERLSALEIKVEQTMALALAAQAATTPMQAHLPAVLNAIASTSGTARLLARETEQVRTLIDRLDAAVGQDRAANEAKLDALTGHVSNLSKAVHAGDQALRDDFVPHIETLGWLLQRVETVRAEMMHELRYGTAPSTTAIEAKIVNPDALAVEDIRLNIGAGHIALDGFVNVDMRELPGIDVVAAIDQLPFEPSSLAEIFSSHTVEHFPELELRRRLLPYWFGLLRAGGVFRAVVPDLEAMTSAYVRGEITFDVLRSVIFGGQEYEGDFHFTGFTPSSMSELLVEAGFQHPTVIARGRRNGDSLEFEISAIKPAN